MAKGMSKKKGYSMPKTKQNKGKVRRKSLKRSLKR